MSVRFIIASNIIQLSPPWLTPSCTIMCSSAIPWLPQTRWNPSKQLGQSIKSMISLCFAAFLILSFPYHRSNLIWSLSASCWSSKMRLTKKKVKQNNIIGLQRVHGTPRGLISKVKREMIHTRSCNLWSSPESCILLCRLLLPEVSVGRRLPKANCSA